MGALHDREVTGSKTRSGGGTVGSLMRRGLHLEMSLEEAALLTQKIWRGFCDRAKKDQLNLNARLHLGYELHVLEVRKTRKGLFIGFLQHMAYMSLLVAVFFMQHGNTVNNRYVLVDTLKSYVGGLKTPSGVQFQSIGSVADVWDWTENAFFEEFAGTSGRVYVRTYNQVIGSVGLTTTRVSDDSCEYRHSAWTKNLLQARRSVLYASEFETNSACYGPATAGLVSKPFGPAWDSKKWESETDRFGSIVYSVPLGKDPVYARRKLAELRNEEFISMNTRTAQLKMAVYNNALPTLCFLSIKFNISPTGKFTTDLTIEGMNVQEYMGDDWWVEALLEAVLIFWTAAQLFKELVEVVRSVREKGVCGGLGKYLSNVWNVLDLMRSAGFVLAISLWVSLVMDTSRNIDLDTVEFVDLEAPAETFRIYNLLFNLVILITLFSMLQYTALDDRMALLTRSVFESMGDLVPFMLIFLMFVVTFGLVGHLLYGPVLVEWSTIGFSMITSIDLIMGNYMFVQLKESMGDEEYLSLIVGALYFYVYFFLMMLVVMNIVIAILMDGYASVKENLGSSVEEQIKYNVEAEGSVMLLAMRDQVHKVTRLWHKVALHQVDKWSDERWIRDLNQVCLNRKLAEQTKNVLRTGTLVMELRALPTTAKDEDVGWQVLQMFQAREWQAPENIEDPFTEPKIDGMVVQLVGYMHEQDRRNRKLMQLVSEMHSHQMPAKGSLAPEPSRSQSLPVEVAPTSVDDPPPISKSSPQTSPR